MKFSLDNGSGTYRITAHQPGHIRVNDIVVDYPVIITPEQMMQWGAEDFDSLASTHFEQLTVLEPEILLFGSGSRQRFPRPELYQSLLHAGIGMELPAVDNLRITDPVKMNPLPGFQNQSLAFSQVL